MDDMNNNNNCDIETDSLLPRGCRDSRILNESMTKQILDVLPARAKENDWVRIYSSHDDGFSLATMYRKMESCGLVMTPVLLVIRDDDDNVFGAVTSTKLHRSSSYYGTGDATFLYRFIADERCSDDHDDDRPIVRPRRLETFGWTGANDFFVHSTADFLSVGGGDGHYGLWLEATLDCGFSQPCATFNNFRLSGRNENGYETNGRDSDGAFFMVLDAEAFGFTVLV